MNQAPFIEAPPPIPNFRYRRVWPRLGPALWMAGVLLWAYVALGRLIVNQGFPEGVGAVVVLGCFAIAAYSSLEQSLRAEPLENRDARRARIVQALLLGFGLFCGAVSLAIIVGLTSGDDLDEPLTYVLVLLALAGIVFGKRATSTAGAPVALQRRALSVGLWFCGVLLTLLAWIR
jgi:hypothetical protein